MKHPTFLPLLSACRRAIAIVINASLLLSMASCKVWRQQVTSPSAPTKPSSQPVQPPAQSSKTQQEQAEAEARASDLFNRGENDLACDEVQRALTLQGQAPISLQLKRFQQACTPN